MNDFTQQNVAFVSRLVEICKDRGHRAALRRWWSDTTLHYALPVLGRLGALDDRRVNPRTIAAALYAVHAGEGASAHAAGGASAGQAALRLAGGSINADGFDSMERHFRRLLAADNLHDLAAQLHRLVKRLERESIPLDYAALLSDLRQFSNNAEKVKTRWALHFWQAPSSELTAP